MLISRTPPSRAVWKICACRKLNCAVAVRMRNACESRRLSLTTSGAATRATFGGVSTRSGCGSHPQHGRRIRIGGNPPCGKSWRSYTIEIFRKYGDQVSGKLEIKRDIAEIVRAVLEMQRCR